MILDKFKYAFDNKRYHTWNYYLRNTFGEKVFKVSINAGFTCPNIDGSLGYGGCTYCSKEGSGDFAGNPKDNLISQFYNIKEMMLKNGLMQSILATFKPIQIRMLLLKF